MEFPQRRKEPEKEGLNFEGMMETELGKKIAESFNLFDKLGNKCIEISNVGHVVIHYTLGLFR